MLGPHLDSNSTNQLERHIGDNHKIWMYNMVVIVF